MSSWIPASLKRSTTTATPPPPLEDAPLDALPASEVKPLATLEAKICDKVFSSPGLLHSSDPWRMLSPTHRRSLFLRFLRYQTLNVDKAAAHIERVARWRAEERPWTLPASAMCGPRAGLPMLELGIRGMDAEILMYGLAKHYVKAEVDHAAQQEAIKVMFEQLFYVPTGSLGRSGVLIVDFNELSMRNVDLVATKNGIRIFLNYYPEMFKKIMLINYPKWIYGSTYPLFSTMYAILCL